MVVPRNIGSTSTKASRKRTDWTIASDLHLTDAADQHFSTLSSIPKKPVTSAVVVVVTTDFILF